MELAGGQRQGGSSTLTFARDDDGALTGSWSGGMGETELENLRFEDGVLHFDRPLQRRAGGGAGQMGGRGPSGRSLAVTVRIEEGILAGTMSTPRGEMTFTGRRAES